MTCPDPLRFSRMLRAIILAYFLTFVDDFFRDRVIGEHTEGGSPIFPRPRIVGRQVVHSPRGISLRLFCRRATDEIVEGFRHARSPMRKRRVTRM